MFNKKDIKKITKSVIIGSIILGGTLGVYAANSSIQTYISNFSSSDSEIGKLINGFFDSEGYIETEFIKDNSITGAKIVNDSIGETQIDDNFKAKDSEKLDGNVASDFQKKLTSQCSSDEAIQSIEQDGTVVCVGSDGINGGGTLPGSSLWTENGSDIYRSSGNVGIGTSSPSEKLEVNGNVKMSGRLRVNGNVDGPSWKMGVTGNIIQREGNAVFGYNGGNVGIGTSSPSEKLEVNGGKLVIKNAGKYTTYGPGNTSYSHFYTNADVGYYFNKGLTVDTGKIASYNESLELGVANSTKITINSEGKFVFGGTSNRRGGIYGTYDYRKAANIWSMGTAYQVAADGSTLGNLYGLAYKYASYGGGGTLAGGHQMVWNQNGTPYFAAGTNVWVKNSVYATAFIYNSDRRLKKNIKILNDSLEKISKMRGVSFNWKKSGNKEIGLIAQEVEEVYPDLVTTNEDGMKGVKYGNVVAILIEGIKELYNKVLGNSDRIDELEKENELLKERLDILEGKIDMLVK